MSINNLISFCGIFVLLGLAWCLSTNRKCVNWRLLIWGLGIQFLFAIFIFYTPVGVRLFGLLNAVVLKALSAATAGTEFMFGPLAKPPGTEGSIGFVFACQALPTVVFFAALMSVLYYFRVMPLLIRGFSYVFTKLLRISGAESLCAASNIFVGIEAATTIRPHLKDMTRSEFCTILTVSMATVASSVLALYVMFLSDVFESIAGHLISASFLSAPAALMMSKLILPETEEPKTLGVNVKPHYEKDGSFIEAVISGSNAGMKLILGIAALLLAVLGLVALLDIVLGLGGLSLAGILSWLLYPFAWIMGVTNHEEALIVSRLVGMRAVMTEIPAYQELATLLANGELSRRSAVIATYALCGFANFGSVAILLGGIGSLVPERRQDLAKLGLKTMAGGALASFLTATIAGIITG